MASGCGASAARATCALPMAPRVAGFTDKPPTTHKECGSQESPQSVPPKPAGTQELQCQQESRQQTGDAAPMFTHSKESGCLGGKRGPRDEVEARRMRTPPPTYEGGGGRMYQRPK